MAKSLSDCEHVRMWHSAFDPWGDALWWLHGSDLTMRAVADDKHMQLVGVRDPLDSLVEEAEVDPDHVKRLAEAYLGRHKGAARS